MYWLIVTVPWSLTDMLKLLTDAFEVLRLRYRVAEHYRYPPQVMVAAIFILSMVNAGLFAAYIGHTPAAATAGLMLAITLTKWLLLAFVMQVFLHYKGAPKMNLFGFILLTEFLNVPLIVSGYLPALAAVALVWQFWTLFVQVRGLMVFSRINPWWVGLAYVIYFALASLVGMLILSFFIANGWIDAGVIEQQMKLMQEMPGSP